MKVNWKPERPGPAAGRPRDEGLVVGMPGVVGESTWDKAVRWYRHAPAERLPLPVFLTSWPASWLMNEFHVPASIPLCATCAAAGISYLTWWRRDSTFLHASVAKVLSWLTPWRHENKQEQVLRVSAAAAAGLSASALGWVTAADKWGPLGGPQHALSWIYLAGWAYGYWWLRRHEAVQAARQRRDEAAALQALKAEWHSILPRAGLAGWHLAKWRETNLGYELMLVGSPETGLASRIASHSSGIEENLCHLLDLPYGRVDITTTERPGQLIVSVRTTDVSVRQVAYHPMTLPWPDAEPSPFAEWFPETASILDPAVWGFVPEDSSQLSIRLLNEYGGRVIGIMGKTGSGKTALLNALREFITRCPDARMVQLNGAKMADETVWEPLSALTLCGSVAHDEVLAGNIATALAALCLLVTERSETLADSGHSVFQPTAENPAVIVIIDEVDEIVAHVPGAGRMLEFLASKQRASGVTLLLAAQRFVVTSIGGGQVRANMAEVLVGLVERDSEARHATGADSEIPDIRDYSKGVPGYFQVWDTGAKQVTGRGRVLLLGKPPKEIAYVKRLVAQRRHLRDWGIPDLPGMTLDGGRSAMGAPATSIDQDLASMRAMLADTPGPAAQAAAQPATPQGPGAGTAAPGVQLAVRAHTLGIPQGDLARLEPLLSRPQGMSRAEGETALRKSRSTVAGYLQILYINQLVTRRGEGKAIRYWLAGLSPSAGDRPAAGSPAAAEAGTAGGTAEEPQPAGGYVTLHDLAMAAEEGHADVDDQGREVLAQVRQLHPRRAAGDDPESEVS